MSGRQRFLAADIDHCPGQMAQLQGLDQIAVNHRHAAPGVDEQRLGVEAGKQCGIVQVMGRRGVRQQVDDIIDLPHQTSQLAHRRHFDKRRLLTGLAGDAVEFDAEGQEKLGNPLANVTGTDNQHPAPFQAASGPVVPLAFDLADQTRHHFPLVTEHVGQDVLGHDLAEDADRPGQAIVALQTVSQQRGDPGPGRLQPLRLVALA
ncbi:hypothetical protein D3C81_1364140 [compost metagenome]